MIRDESEIRQANLTHGNSTCLPNPYGLGNTAAGAFQEGFMAALHWVLNPEVKK